MPIQKRPTDKKAAPKPPGLIFKQNRKHPLDNIEWVDPKMLHANNYNPNHVFTPEMRLLKISILEDGWTQPIVARKDGEIIDGFHRWTLGSKDADIIAVSGGKVPVVRIENTNEAKQMMSTIRHNRARGQHGILKMADIVRRLKDLGYDEQEIVVKLQMEDEEVERLISTKASPENKGMDSFGRGWVPNTDVL